LAPILPAATDIVIRHLLERNASERPDEVFVTFEDGVRWTRADGVMAAYAAANALCDSGVRQGDRVAVFLPNGPDLLRAWWGANALGATIVPINVAYKGNMLRYVLDLTEPTVIVASDDLLPRLDEIDSPVLRIPTPVIQRGRTHGPALDRPIEVWDYHSIILTSGTTGPSKASLTTHLQAYLTGSWCPVDWGLDGGDVFLIDLPLFHNAAQAMTIASLATRTRLAIRSAPAMTAYWETARAAGATVGFLLSSMVGFLLAQPAGPRDTDHSLRLMIASPLPGDCEAFQRRFGVQDVITAYGSTESSGPLVRAPGTPLVPGFCGRVRDGYEVRLVDEHDVEVPPGQLGELIVRSDLPWTTSAGYVKDPAGTAAAWRNGWFHTADVLRRDDDGNFYFHDRLKDAVRRRGENISSYEVELEVAAHPGVQEAACVAVPGAAGAEDEVKVFIVVRDGAELEPGQLLAFLADRMPHFMVPRYYEFIDQLPKTETMKVRKHRLRDMGNSDRTWDRQSHGWQVTRRGLLRTP
jgi:crotonobetaine/carnitine-CoA ligase